MLCQCHNKMWQLILGHVKPFCRRNRITYTIECTMSTHTHYLKCLLPTEQGSERCVINSKNRMRTKEATAAITNKCAWNCKAARALGNKHHRHFHLMSHATPSLHISLLSFCSFTFQQREKAEKSNFFSARKRKCVDCVDTQNLFLFSLFLGSNKYRYTGANILFMTELRNNSNAIFTEHSRIVRIESHATVNIQH